MLLLYEDHAVVGRQLGRFEAVCRDEWMPLIASSVDGRLLCLDVATMCVLGYEREERALRVWNA